MKNSDSRLAILTPSISRLGGGMFFSVRHLSRELVSRGITVKVFSTIDRYSEIDLKSWDDVPVQLYKSTFGKFGYVRHAYNHLINFRPHTVYLNGIWTYQSILTLRASLRGVKTVIAPRGMIDSWALMNSRIQKLAALSFYEKLNFNNANTIHALCDDEAKSIKNTFPNANIQIISNGIHVPVINQPNLKLLDGKKRPFTLGYIGRLDEKKGLADLILAISRIKSIAPALLPQLVIAGWGNNHYANKLKDMVHKLQLSHTVDFIGQVYGDEKEKFFNHIDIFILPSYSEGLPMAVLDAWVRGIPVLMTDECNLTFSFAENAAVRITHDPDNMAEIIINFINKNPKELAMIGEKGCWVAKSKYSWDAIADSMVEMLFELQK